MGKLKDHYLREEENELQAISTLAPEVERFDLDGHVDASGVEDIGEAGKMPDGTWRCLANVGGRFCIVEVRIRVRPDMALAAVACLQTNTQRTGVVQ